MVFPRCLLNYIKRYVYSAHNPYFNRIQIVYLSEVISLSIRSVKLKCTQKLLLSSTQLVFKRLLILSCIQVHIKQQYKESSETGN